MLLVAQIQLIRSDVTYLCLEKQSDFLLLQMNNNAAANAHDVADYVSCKISEPQEYILVIHLLAFLTISYCLSHGKYTNPTIHSNLVTDDMRTASALFAIGSTERSTILSQCNFLTENLYRYDDK